MARITGTNGNDRYIGTDANDDIIVSLGDDEIDGAGGSDRLQFWNLKDQTAGVTVNFQDGIISGDNIDHRVINVENSNGTIFADQITGDSNDNGLDGGEGDDIMSGLAGRDNLWGRGGNDQLYGGKDDDFFRGFSGADLIDGGDGDRDQASYDMDFQHGATSGILGNLAEGWIVDGYGDRDTIISVERIVATDFDDTLTGSDGPDEIKGLDGDDQLDGGPDDDILDGGSGNDFILGGGGNDYLTTGDGDDQLFGEAGDDILRISGTGAATLNGGAGNDTVMLDLTNYISPPENFVVGIDLELGWSGAVGYQGALDDFLISIENIDFRGPIASVLVGDEFNNIISGGSGNDKIDGHSGNDHLLGNDGNDTLNGGGGDDTLNGGEGENYLNGGNGNDIFVVIDDFTDWIPIGGLRETPATKGFDIISDTGGERDILAISDTPGLDSYRFVNKVNGLEFQFASGRQVLVSYQSNGENPIEIFRWFRDSSWGVGGSYSAEFRIVTDHSDIVDTSTMYAGKDVAEIITLPNLVGDTIDTGVGWSEVYLNGGNDTVYMSKNINFIVHGGDGDDSFFSADETAGEAYMGLGDDTFNGGEGNDFVNGQGGDDLISTGGGNDTLDGGAGNDTLTGGIGSDLFVFRGVFDHDIITDFDAIEDRIEFYSEDGSAIAINELTETINGNGNRVLTTINGLSSVTFEEIEKVDGAIYAINKGSGADVSLEFYVHSSMISGDVNSFDLVLTFDSDGAEYVSSDLSNFLGFPNVIGNTIALSGISLSGVSVMDPLFTINFDDLDLNADLSIQVSDVLVNNIAQAGSTLSIGGPEFVDVSVFVTSRSGGALSDVMISIDDGTEVVTVNSSSSGISTVPILSGSNVGVTAALSYDTTSKSITSQDALDALRLSVGMATQAGTNTAFDYIAADFNQDGRVTSQDALAILKQSVGLPTAEKAQWVFVDANGDLSAISRSDTSFEQGINIFDLSQATELGLTGILIGDVNDSYSTLIA